MREGERGERMREGERGERMREGGSGRGGREDSLRDELGAVCAARGWHYPSIG